MVPFTPNLVSPELEPYIVPTKSGEGRMWLCHSCHKDLKDEKIPTFAKCNIQLPDLPEALQDMTEIEERLVALRIPFMSIWTLGNGGQKKLKGSVTNVPTDLSRIQTALPRRMEESQTVPVFLKRKLQYNHSYMQGAIRPGKIQAAVEYLSQREGSLWQQQGVTIRPQEEVGDADEWVREQERAANPPESGVDVFDGCVDMEVDGEVPEAAADANPDEELVGDESDNEEDTERAGNESTMFMVDGIEDALMHPKVAIEKGPEDSDSDAAEDLFRGGRRKRRRREIEPGDRIAVAPGEGQQVLGFYEDQEAEAMSFPTIWGGMPVPVAKRNGTGRKVHPYLHTRWLFRHSDNRATRNLQYLFYKTRRAHIDRIRSQTWIKLRKGQFHSQRYSAKEVRSPDFRNAVVNTDVAFRDLKDVRGSPGYWEAVKKALFAMFRQLGKPTFFFSLSMADTQWVHLLRTLTVLAGTPMTDEEIEAMKWGQRAKLIRENPVACARIFNHKVASLFKHLLLKCPEMLGGVEDFFWRVESQQRGSLHLHGLMWSAIQNAWKGRPIEECGKAVCEAISKYVTCSSTAVHRDLLKLQVHKHKATCKKKKTRTIVDSISRSPQCRSAVFCTQSKRGPRAST